MHEIIQIKCVRTTVCLYMKCNIFNQYHIYDTKSVEEAEEAWIEFYT